MKYIVITPGTEAGKEHNVKRFDSAAEAIENFKKREGDAELVIGKDLNNVTTIANMVAGKVDYVAREHRQLYYTPPLTNTFYLDRGAGYNIVQGSNLLQGRSVFRDDHVSRSSGQQYEAWSQFLFDSPKDKWGNYQIKQYSEGYGYDVAKTLQDYNIKLPANPKELESLLDLLKDGERVTVPTEFKGESVMMKIEAVPRYGNLNFYQLDGKPEKREQFVKEQAQVVNLDKGKEKGQSKGQDQGMSV